MKQTEPLNRWYPLKWDSDFFRIAMARIEAQQLSVRNLENELRAARDDGIEFIELFCDADDSQSIRAAENQQFHLGDVRVSLTCPLDRFREAMAPDGLALEPAAESDISILVKKGKGLFTHSRYRRYPGFRRETVDSLFAVWIENAVRGTFDDEMMVARKDSQIAAFCSLKHTPPRSRIGLFGVIEAFQQLGLGEKMLRAMIRRLRSADIKHLDCVTQGANRQALRLYQREGFFHNRMQLCYYRRLKEKNKS